MKKSDLKRGDLVVVKPFGFGSTDVDVIDDPMIAYVVHPDPAHIAAKDLPKMAYRHSYSRWVVKDKDGKEVSVDHGNLSREKVQEQHVLIQPLWMMSSLLGYGRAARDLALNRRSEKSLTKSYGDERITPMRRVIPIQVSKIDSLATDERIAQILADRAMRRQSMQEQVAAEFARRDEAIDNAKSQRGEILAMLDDDVDVLPRWMREEPRPSGDTGWTGGSGSIDLPTLLDIVMKARRSGYQAGLADAE